MKTKILLLCLCSVLVVPHLADAAPKYDFDAMMKSAPVLDLKDPKFDGKKALAWAKTSSKRYAQAFEDASQAYRDKHQAAFARYESAFASKNDQRAADSMKRVEKALLDIVPTGEAEAFCRNYGLAYARETVIFLESMACFNRLLEKMEAREPEIGGRLVLWKQSIERLSDMERKKAIEDLRANMKKIRGLTFSRLDSELELSVVRMQYDYLEAMAKQLDTFSR